MTAIRVSIRFDSWFRVGSAYPRDGLDVAVDHTDPLPGDHLKGVMRAEARWLTDLGHAPAGLVDEVFGTPARPSLWAWSSAEPTAAWQYTTRQRTAIDGETHAAVKDHTVSGELVWTPTASFVVTYQGPGDAPPHHAALIRTSAACVHHIGAWRRRGLGAVNVAPDPVVTAEELHALAGSAAGSPVTAEGGTQ